MWKRLWWLYLSQKKLLYYPLSPAIRWLLQGIFEEWLFSYLTTYAETRTGVIVDIILWTEAHPSLSTGILVAIPAVIVAIWWLTDVKKKLGQIKEAPDILLNMFQITLKVAEDKAQNIEYDKEYDAMMKRIIKDIFSIDAQEYKGKDMRDNKEIAKVEEKIRQNIPSDEDTVHYYRLVASALVNNGYGITEILGINNQYQRFKIKIEKIRKVPSEAINTTINKCLDYIYILSHNYLSHIVRLNNPKDVGEQTLAQLRNFVVEQKENTGDMSKCLTELRIEIDEFLRGNKDDGKH